MLQHGDAELFDRVQAVLRSHANGEKQRVHHHYLKGTVFCARCRARLCITNAKGRYLYFFCLARQKGQAASGSERSSLQPTAGACANSGQDRCGLASTRRSSTRSTSRTTRSPEQTWPRPSPSCLRSTSNGAIDAKRRTPPPLLGDGVRIRPIWWRWGDSNSSPPPQVPPGGGCASRLTCDSLLRPRPLVPVAFHDLPASCVPIVYREPVLDGRRRYHSPVSIKDRITGYLAVQVRPWSVTILRRSRGMLMILQVVRLGSIG
jgi:hypothetical protein